MSRPDDEKDCVALPESLIDSARSEASSQDFLSSVAENLRLAEHMADLDEFLASHAADHGQIPNDVVNEVRQAWPNGTAL